MNLAIDVHGLNKSFGDKRVVQDVSIQVEHGRICGFLGPNGSGKTTTLRMLCGLLTPDSGQGTCLGLDIIGEANAIKRQTGYMTQKFSLYEDLTLEENLMFSARVHELDHRKERVIHALSAEGLTVLVSTHYMDEAERCHEIAYIAYGKLIARGTADEVVARSNLVTFNGEGPGIDRLSGELAARPGVEMAAPFGAALHVSGSDRAALEAAIAPYRRAPFRWTEVDPTLEDVFIQLMEGAEDNFR